MPQKVVVILKKIKPTKSDFDKTVKALSNLSFSQNKNDLIKTYMNTAGVVLEAVCVCHGVEWLTWRGGDEPLWPLAEELEDGVDPDGQHDRHDDDLVHVGDVHCEEVALTRHIPHSYHQVWRNVFAMNLLY